ncbi:alpha/beta hydrolase family protein [Microbulbifer pacificus]|uniref:alpha/beta hydrolase family protein n=1 Tax=Microbulbifer pacificus TaxID=407164 RepID=UPI0018F88397|nr:alpha/beta fold hydrolase [Microbulbifer pacificus]
MDKCKPTQHFMQHEQMDFEIQALLGGCFYQATDAGEILAMAERIPSGDFEQWYRQWFALGERIQSIAEECLADGHIVSARQAFLRAANYFATSINFIDGTTDPSRGLNAWKRHRHCWDRFCAHLNPHAEQVQIPYENTAMPGYFFRPAVRENPNKPLATIIFNNGSDGATSCMWQFGVAAALERGYAALVFDGPGQNAMLWLQGIPFRHDWEKVVGPVVDFLSDHPDVDTGKIALSGLSQGGYWILRALAFEHRIAVGMADPGVMDVSTSFFRHMPPEMIALLDAGEKDAFNEAMEEGLNLEGHSVRQNLAWRMKPYGVKNYFDLYRAVRQYSVRDLINQIQCPIFIADPEGEQFWPGQSGEVYSALTSAKTLARFTAEEGAAWHCEPKARSLYDQRMFDWLAGIMPA